MLTLRASEAVRSTLFYGIKTASRVTVDEVQKTSAYKAAVKKMDSGSAGDGERGAQLADAGAAVVSAGLGVLYASRRGARILVDETKDTIVDVAQHRRGEGGGQAAKQALDAVDSLGMAVFNCCSLVTSPESLAFELSAEAADATLSKGEWFGGTPLLSAMLRRVCSACTQAHLRCIPYFSMLSPLALLALLLALLLTNGWSLCLLCAQRSALTMRFGSPLLAVLRPKSLALYTAASARDSAVPQAPCVVVPVEDIERVTILGEASEVPVQWAAEFELRTRDQVLHRLAAEDDASRQQWVELLRGMVAKTDAKKGLDVSPALVAPGASGSGGL